MFVWTNWKKAKLIATLKSPDSCTLYRYTVTPAKHLNAYLLFFPSKL